jgi:hypothetical protein
MNAKTMVIVCAAAFGMASITPASADTSDPAAVAADALIGRPLCLAATIVGSAIFVVSLPIAATSGSIHTAADALVVTPARATFTRPLGDFDYNTSLGEQTMAKQTKSKTKKARRVAK